MAGETRNGESRPSFPPGAGSAPGESAAAGQASAEHAEDRSAQDKRAEAVQADVRAFLVDPSTHGGTIPVQIDTHGAVVVLAGPDVYKMKRAVRLPFMDLSTIEKRQAACEREVEVNAGFAPSLYRGVVPVTREPAGALVLGGDAAPVEWLVHMRRFDETLTFDHIADRGELDDALLQATAAVVADAHAKAPVRRAAAFVDHLRAIVDENTATLLDIGRVVDPDRIDRLAADTRRALEAAAPMLHRRVADGYVRRCHADLHLRNIVLLDGRPTLFDALEFDEDLATIDVLYDLAFLVMDLLNRDRLAEANRVFNRYLTEARDDAGLPGVAAMPLFLAVRATIRAKIEAVRLRQTGEASFRQTAERYLVLAEAALLPVPPRLVAIGGLSGSGKSSVAARIAARAGSLPGGVHLRSDVERKAVFGVAELERLPESAYDLATTDAVYAVLYRKAETVLRAGLAVIVDAVHQQEGERLAVAAVAERLGLRFDGIWLDAPAPTLAGRVADRHGDASDADQRVVAEQVARDCGPIRWHRVDAARPLDSVVADVEAILGLTAPSA
jgi:aminoglycoside phosphotransferase family enzyme/predicted kinase